MQSNEQKETPTDKKSYKREVAFLLFMWLVYIVETKEPELVQILTFPIFTFGALAFGLQWYAPNGSLLKPQSYRTSDRRGSKRSSEHTSREDEYTNDWDYNHQRAEASETPSERHPTDSRHQSSKVG